MTKNIWQSGRWTTKRKDDMMMKKKSDTNLSSWTIELCSTKLRTFEILSPSYPRNNKIIYDIKTKTSRQLEKKYKNETYFEE